VIEFAADGTMVRYWGDKKKGTHPDWRLDFFSGFDVLPSGNVIAANWLCGFRRHWTAVPGILDTFRSAATLLP